MSEDRIERVAAQGRVNKANFRLVENWCAHIRIERSGGVGMIEQMTGDPIGHFGPACDHADAGSMMSWDIRDSAVDFYDRHCSTCAVRKPVREPNLSQWVAERDAAVADQQARLAAAAQAATDAATVRREQRTALKAGLTPAAADVVDQLEELDGAGTAALVQRFAETARLAPEAFPAPVREHLFALLDAELPWAEDAALAALTYVEADPPRLVALAATALRRGNLEPVAVRAFLRSLQAASEADIATAFPALVELADPQREPFTTIARAQQAPLNLTARAFPEIVKKQIAGWLSNGSAGSAAIGARAVEALARRERLLAMGFARDLVGTLVRAKWMPDAHDLGYGPETAAARDVETAIIELFGWEPAAIDDLLQKFLAGASAEGERRVYRVYHWVFSKRSYDDKRPVNATERLAFSRLFRAAPKATNWDVLNVILEAIRDRPDRYAGLAQEFTDELLGGAIALDERLVAFEAEPKPTTTLDGLERNNHRDTLWRLRGTLVDWAAAGVAATGNPAAYVAVMENIPEVRDSFAACMVEHSVGLATTAEGLNAILPSLYAGLVGASFQRRAAAAKAIGELPSQMRRHAPDLLFEAFVPTLTDPYRHVHRTALRALRYMTFPDALSKRVGDAVSALVVYYGKTGEEHDLLVDGIEILVGDHLSEDQRAGRPGAHLVAILAKLPWWSLSSHIHYLARQLGRAKGLVDLLISRLTESGVTEHDIRKILDALGGMPNEVVFEHRAQIAGVAAGPTWETRRRVHGLVELLSRAGAWAEAVALAERAVSEIPDTRREQGQRQLMALMASSARYELAQANGDTEAADSAAQQWRDLRAEIERGRDAA